jgi:hypothetical protein
MSFKLYSILINWFQINKNILYSENLIADAALNRQAARMGEQSSVPQTWTTLATCKAAVWFLLNDGICMLKYLYKEWPYSIVATVISNTKSKK